MILRQMSYAEHYAKAGLTPEKLRRKAARILALADILEMEQLPMDPFDILRLEDQGWVVDLESGQVEGGQNDS